MIQKNYLCHAILLLLGGCLSLGSCSNDDSSNLLDKENRITTDEQFFANHFAHDLLELCYYWNEEIASDLIKLNPNNNTDPIATVEEIRYHKGDKKIDKWTQLFNNIQQFQDNVSGISTTYGYMPITYQLEKEKKECISAVSFVYDNSPAAKAGLKRGDIIYKINGQTLTTDNYEELYNSSSITLSMATMKIESDKKISIIPTGKEIHLIAMHIYEDPILVDSIYEISGKKIGYLAYTNFDLASIDKLIRIAKNFKTQGVEELILDLRYNGGGYVITENVMASMFAPQDVVTAGKLFEKEKFNKQVTQDLAKNGENGETPFMTEFKFKNNNNQTIVISTKESNIGLKKVYGLISKNTASASEALLSGLMPYMDVEVIGKPSHGKYCTGWMIAAKDAYETVPKPISKWGIYVMASIYQNANGETPCMPDGLQPSLFVDDNPILPEQLGDVNEKLLKVALQRAGKIYNDRKTRSEMEFLLLNDIETPHKASFGKRIHLPSEWPFNPMN